jgi:uncharacterized protein (TIGR01244 family)
MDIKKFISYLSLIALATCLQTNAIAQEQEEKVELIRALIVDGQNNHKVWRETTKMMQTYLEESGRFSVEVARTAGKGTDPDFQPEFSNYDVVISNYNGSPWPEATKEAFVAYVKGGGGFVSVHAADNAFPNWPEYNQMIGLGGWGGRNEKSGPLVYFDGAGKEVRDESAGRGGGHGRQHPFAIVARNDEHPIMQDLPVEWMHAQDELYERLRGPAENMTVLATAFAQPKFGGSGRHEPMLMTIEFGEGRCVQSTLGHAGYSMECVGFITTFLRSAEWAATSSVTIPIPDDFPTADKQSKRAFIESVVAAELGATKNVTQVGKLFLAGQPTEADIEVIKATGITQIITLRKSGEVKWDEQAAIEKAGMQFHELGFKQPDELSDEVFDQIRTLLKSNKDEKVLLHCGSANRVGAVWAAYRVLDQGVPAEQAIKEAKQIGLRSEAYEQRLNEYLSGNEK